MGERLNRYLKGPKQWVKGSRISVIEKRSSIIRNNLLGYSAKNVVYVKVVLHFAINMFIGLPRICF